MNNPYFEIEDNDSCAQANGPLLSGQNYYGYPDDQKDYFNFTTGSSGSITATLTNHTGTGVQLQLRDSLCNLITYDYTAPYQVTYAGAAGTLYNIFIFTSSGYNNSTAYTLNVFYP